jgi:hypothetical protein
MKEAKSGKPYAIATVTDYKGAEFSNVTLFDPACNKNIGEALIGTLTPNDYNGKTGWKFAEEKTTGNYPKRSPAPFAAAVKAKQEGIEKSQDRKEESIQKASIIRDSTILTVAESQGKMWTSSDFETCWKGWKAFLETQWTTPF